MTWAITSCAPEHVAQLERRNGHSLERIRNLLESRRAELAGQARTVWHDERPVGAFGLVTIAPEIVEAWSLLTEDAVHLPIRLVREVRRSITEAWATLPIRRMEAQCIEGDWISYRWLNGIGFKAEGLLRKRGPHGEDVTMFAMTEKPPERARRDG